VAQFLKGNFLRKSNRYLVFSSHIISTTGSLSDFMEAHSSYRPVLVEQLPIIPSLQKSWDNLNVKLNAREALYYGKVPALIYEAGLDSIGLPVAKRDAAIETCINTKLVSEETVKNLLGTFINGRIKDVLTPLLPLMDTTKDGQTNQVLWIPFHILGVLQRFRSIVSRKLGNLLSQIERLFSRFKDSKHQSGDGWEALFVIALLVRSITEQFDSLLPLESMMSQSIQAEVSYNALFDQSSMAFQDVTTMDEFLKRIEEPQQFPCIAIYYFSNASFEDYDVVVAAYDKNKKRELYAYQLREGKKNPKSKNAAQLRESFVIRGQPPQTDNTSKGWTVVSEQRISDFFGVSGRNWTPSKWKELNQKK